MPRAPRLMNVRRPSRVTFRQSLTGFLLLSLSGLSVTVLPQTACASPKQSQANSGIELLFQQMKARDFRVRVQAALLLGKLAQPTALPILQGGLKDSSAAVRAASAAALGIFGDPSALSALAQVKRDPSLAVRRTAVKSIRRLHSEMRAEKSERSNAEVYVQLAEAPRSAFRSPEAFAAAVQATRKALRKMKGVALLRPSEDPQQMEQKQEAPVLVLQPSIQRLQTRAQGEKLIVSASVEFVVQGNASNSILGRLSGTASAAGLKAENRGQAALRLEGQAVGAAARSAIDRAKAALLRAAARS